MQIYELEYQSLPLATVEVDENVPDGPIKEMVEFWDGWEERLAKNGGDYIKAWLKQLGMFILWNRRKPNSKIDEGWYPLDGSCGVRLVDWTAFEPDEDDISIE